MAFIKFMGGWDVHGDMQDAAAVKAFLTFAEIWKPKIRICGGDLFDLRPLRRGACDDERRESIKADIKAGKDWFNKFRPTVYLRGNHCERLWDLAALADGPASDYARDGVGEVEAMVNKHKCLMLPYHKCNGIFQLGDTNFLHGFAGGIYAARKHAMVYGACQFGHVHFIDEAPVPGLIRRHGRAVGCLCQTDLLYNQRQMETLKQEHGWSYGFLNNRTKAVHSWQARKIDGQWIIPSDFVTL